MQSTTTTITTTPLTLQQETQHATNSQQYYETVMNTINNTQDDTYNRLLQQQNITPPSLPINNSTLPEPPLPSPTTVPPLSSSPNIQLLQERQRLNDQLKYDTRPIPKRSVKKPINNENQPAAEEEIRQPNTDPTLENIINQGEQQNIQLQQESERFQQNAAIHDQHANILEHLNNNNPFLYLSRIYNLVISWIPSHPYLTATIAITGIFFVTRIFGIRAGAVSSSSIINNIVNLFGRGGNNNEQITNNSNQLVRRNQSSNTNNLWDTQVTIRDIGFLGGISYVLRRMFGRR